MKKQLLILFAIFVGFAVAAQENEDTDKGVKHIHQIKIGSSLQYEWGGGYYYDDYYYPMDLYYYYSHRTELLSDYDGPNTRLFVAYEHIWEMPNKLALAIEPKIGMSFREYMENAFAGANWKFYWANMGIWRMGIYLYTGYEYNRSDKTIFVDMHNGMYSQQKDIKLNEHVMALDLGLVPFQFKPRGIPLIIECNVNMLGLHIFKTISSKYELSENESTRYRNSEAGGYGPRIELKLGWQLSQD